ncbi:MAG: hypothetical protein FWE68_03580 [Defluviitaleaceae bacterium]|nr:hypothetical protein [Defluviitaleaceae bacterium]
MPNQRLSKLQKWILTASYKVTVLLDNKCLKALDGKLCYMHPCKVCSVNQNRNAEFNGKEYIAVEKDSNNCIGNKCGKAGNYSCHHFELYREDILLSYFNLEKSSKSVMMRMQRFKDCPEYKKAHVTVTRTLKALETGGYICQYGGGELSTSIRLTDKGAEKAAELLGMREV